MDAGRSNTKVGENATDLPEFDALTNALRQMHDSVASEPIPDDFLDLLDKIEAKWSASKKNR
jgi:hypothetical protein